MVNSARWLDGGYRVSEPATPDDLENAQSDSTEW
ncbi:MAG: hypothetical protein IH989_01215 [Planctomycetes bacterium]|nr:hypothetical protein [Planctomycetota bacterium]